MVCGAQTASLVNSATTYESSEVEIVNECMHG